MAFQTCFMQMCLMCGGVMGPSLSRPMAAGMMLHSRSRPLICLAVHDKHEEEKLAVIRRLTRLLRR